MRVRDEAELIAVRHRWALEELTLDALYQELNRMYGNPKAQFRYVRRLFRSKQTARQFRRAGRLEDVCEELALYRFSVLRESSISMLLYLMEFHKLDLSGLVRELKWLVYAQRGRAKTIGLVVDTPVKRAAPVRKEKKRDWLL